MWRKQLACSILSQVKISRALGRVILEVLSATEILSPLNVKRSEVQKGRFLQRKQRVKSCKFQQNCTFNVFTLKLQVANYELNLEPKLCKKVSKLLKLLKTKLQQLSNTSFKIFFILKYSLSKNWFSQLKLN